MKLLKNIDVLDEFITRDIKFKKSNQKELVYLIKFHLKNGFLLKHNGNVHLQEACRVKKNNIVDFLIKSGADVNFLNSGGESTINSALLQFGFHVRSKPAHACVLVDKLIGQGAMLSMQNKQGRTVLHQWAFDSRICYSHGHYSRMILERLLQKNVGVDLVDSEGNNALMHAALHNVQRFIILFETTSKPPPLNRNFILDQQNFAGETCAHILAMRSRADSYNAFDDVPGADALKMLISKGVSLHVQNNAGETVIDCILNSPDNRDYKRKVLYKHTHECMIAVLMGTHSRLGAKSPVRLLDDIALDLILSEIRNQLKSIILALRYTDDEN